MELNNIYLTADELATRWHMAPKTLANWRTQGCGPKFVKTGRRVLYSMSVIEYWEKNRTVANTGEAREVG